LCCVICLGQFGIHNHDRPSETYEIVAVTVYTVDQRAINTTLKTVCTCPKVWCGKNIVCLSVVTSTLFILLKWLYSCYWSNHINTLQC